MKPDSPPRPVPSLSGDPRLRIYLLPNLLTAANLFCGFLALTRIVEADLNDPSFIAIKESLFYIFLACICDLFDGRVARMGGMESPFGREFDSLADIVSFGVAPAFLVHRVVLREVFRNRPEVGWFIASVYVICGAFRLARFNCLASLPGSGAGGGKYFVGFPIPAAAAMVASLTLFLIEWYHQELPLTALRFCLPVILVFLSGMMFSEVRYPTFKSIGWRTQHPFVKALVIAVILGLFFLLWRNILPFVSPLIFTAYLVYGFVRPSISRRVQREIEADDEPDDEEDLESSDSKTTSTGKS